MMSAVQIFVWYAKIVNYNLIVDNNCNYVMEPVVYDIAILFQLNNLQSLQFFFLFLIAFYVYFYFIPQWSSLRVSYRWSHALPFASHPLEKSRNMLKHIHLLVLYKMRVIFSKR